MNWKKKSKKGALFSTLVVLAYTTVLLSAVLFLLSKADSLTGGNAIGHRQFELLDVYAEGEKALVYVEYAGNRALESGIRNLAASSGFFVKTTNYEGLSKIEGAPCGFFNGVPLWNERSGTCYATAAVAKKNLLQQLDTEMSGFLQNYEPVRLPLNNYGYEISGSITVTAAAKQPLSIRRGSVPSLARGDFQWPVETGIGPGYYGPRNEQDWGDGWHSGVDFEPLPEFSDVRAVADGEIIFASIGGSQIGNTVVIRHADNLYSSYSHLRTFEKGLGPVRKGEVIAKSGGGASQSSDERGTPSGGAHLHMSFFRDFEAAGFNNLNDWGMDPFCYLPERSEQGHRMPYEPDCTTAVKIPKAAEETVPGKQPVTTAVEYRLYPSFTAAADYDIDDYDRLVAIAKDMVGSCKEHISYLSCMNGYSGNRNGFAITVGCGAPSEDAQRRVIICAEKDSIQYRFALTIPPKLVEDNGETFAVGQRLQLAVVANGEKVYAAASDEVIVVTMDNRRDLESQAVYALVPDAGFSSAQKVGG